MELREACIRLLSFLSGKKDTLDFGPQGGRIPLTTALLDEARGVVRSYARESDKLEWGTETDRDGRVHKLKAKEGLFTCLEGLAAAAQHPDRERVLRLYPWSLITEALDGLTWERLEKK